MFSPKFLEGSFCSKKRKSLSLDSKSFKILGQQLQDGFFFAPF